MYSGRWLLSSVVSAAFIASSSAVAGVNYQDPAGGWRYTYGGSFNPGVASTGFVGGVGPAGYGKSNDSEALDGTWYHDQSDKWDGTGPGDLLSDPSGPPSDPVGNPLSGNQGTSPGGAKSITDDGVTYIRVQDSGNPEYFGWVQGNVANPTGPSKPMNTNRRVYFGHDMTQDGPFLPPVAGRDGQRVLDNGVTISFRMRIPNSGPMDSVYTGSAQAPVNQPWFIPPEGDYNGNGFVDAADYVLWRKHLGTTFQLANEVPDVTPGQVTAEDYAAWRERFGNGGLGRGYPIHDDGRGMVTILQHNGDESDPFYGVDGTVAFSLVTSKDIQNFCAANPGGTLCSGTGSGGLIMNNRSGDSANNFVDSFDPGQTLNIVEIPDAALKDWHEFWITIVDNGATAGTHAVNVYMDGSTTPITRQVTVSSSNNGAYANFNAAFLEFGLSSSDLFGSFDMDSISYQLGVIAPVAAGSGALAGSAVPEPSSLLLAIVAISSLCLRRYARD